MHYPTPPRSASRRAFGLALALGAALALPVSSARANAPAGRYTIANGAVTDNATKLVWQQTADAGTYTFSGATSYCAALVLDGGGWRVPTLKELMTLVDFSIATPGPTIDTTAFPAATADYFWTSTKLAANPSFAWAVYFNHGYTYYNDVVTPYHVRCVR